MHEVLLEASAERDLEHLPADVFDRVIARIRNFGREPRPAGCRKLAGSKNDWRVRVGDYRILYEIDDRALEVRIMRVRHRREVYR